MSSHFRKGLSVFLAVGSLVFFLVSCQQAPTTQPWDRETGAPVDTAPAGETPEKIAQTKEAQQTQAPAESTHPSASQSPEPTPTPVPLNFVPVGKVKEGVPDHLKEELQLSGCTVRIDADVLVRPREPKSCPIYRVKPYQYDPEKIVQLVYGKDADDALAFDKAAPKPSDRPDLHDYEIDGLYANVDNYQGIMGMLHHLPLYLAAILEDRKSLDTSEDPRVIPSGKCDAISFSSEEAIQKAVSYVEPFKLPVDLTLPRIKAYQWHDFQYYEVIFEQLYGGIPAYTNSFATSLDVSIETGYVYVRICQEGIMNVKAYLTQNSEVEAEYDKVIDYNTAYRLFKEYLSDKLTYFSVAETGRAEIGIVEIAFAYYAVAPEDFDGSQWLMVPCWVFLDSTRNNVTSFAINALDGTLMPN